MSKSWQSIPKPAKHHAECLFQYLYPICIMNTFHLGATYIHSYVVMFEQALENPTLNTDILNVKLWPFSRSWHGHPSILNLKLHYYWRNILVSIQFSTLKVLDMIQNIIPHFFFKHTVILVPKVASYLSDLHGEIIPCSKEIKQILEISFPFWAPTSFLKEFLFKLPVDKAISVRRKP